MKSFHVGDWVFCEFVLQQVKDVEKDRVREVSDGVCSHSGYDLTDRCFPLTLPIKRISDLFEWYSRRIHREGSSGLNYPDIHRWLVETWVRACEHIENETAIEYETKLVADFTRDILDKQQIESGYGFPLMRRGLNANSQS